MPTYQAPLRDMQFVLHELLGAEREFAALPGYEETTRDLIDPVLEEAAKLCENVMSPLSRVGDQEGCTFEDGAVRTPTGFRDAYRAYVGGGWGGLTCNPEFGGQGLPHTLGVFVEEMLQSSNMALALYTGLTHGACIALDKHGSDDLRQRYLPKLVDGTWSGVMCLTESHCGTDLGLLRTRAEPTDDGRYRVTGTKIFITGGEHDLSENIVHFVLARLPDAPPGVKGISMFLVPKFLIGEDGSRGERNTVHCGSIEHKMGIKGASTCVMNYEGAIGYLVGEPHRGMRAMFSMMNYERLMVGQQGLSLAEVAYQNAAAYARERLQGRSLKGPAAPDLPADPIIVHPDVRRMLLTTRAYNEAARALLGWVSLQVDRSTHHPDPAVREQADDAVALFTPVIKAFLTDCGFESCHLCQQVFGGHGYISEWGMEQLVRDVRIAQIYEGTNGIHALDLAGRKLPMHGGRAIRSYIEGVSTFVAERRGKPELEEFVEPLGAALARLTQATQWLSEAAAENPDEVGAASYDYLRLLGLVAFGRMWAESAEIALANQEGDNTGFYRAKLATARFFVRRLLPNTASLLATLSAGADSVMALEAEAF
ncbi:MAG: acyl-CoA dehydrogenase C-terminal domain-containing protein [Thiotrichales bacterium]|nr:acyl-CoA dehydrogenase C-terminal domain-containing protein [Thiotrichales bacterium]